MTRERKRDQLAGRFAQSSDGPCPDNKYHRQQAGAWCDTAAKRLARNIGLSHVRCMCGVEFPAAVPRKPS